MPTKQTNPRLDRLWQFNRGMLRSAFVSLFWGVIENRRRRGGFALQTLANMLGIDKSAVSRWFRGPIQPNWTIDTIADLAHALDLELEIRAVDRQTGEVFTASGLQPVRITAPVGWRENILVMGAANIAGDARRVTAENQFKFAGHGAAAA